MSETSSIQTKRNRKQYNTVKLIKQVRQVTFFNEKKRKICEWQFEAIFRISGFWHVGWWNLIPSVRLIQVGNNRNGPF